MITNTDNVINSCDIIKRIDELSNELFDEYEKLDTPFTFEEWLDVTHFEDDTLGYEYKILTSLAEECSDYAVDWDYGEDLIHEDYFEQYMDEMIDIPNNPPSYLTITVDYDVLQQDYTEVDFDGKTYYIRCV